MPNPQRHRHIDLEVARTREDLRTALDKLLESHEVREATQDIDTYLHVHVHINSPLPPAGPPDQPPVEPPPGRPPSDKPKGR